jgi:uncharacterized membrane protein YoaK (UPF0700 family)
VSWDLIIAFVAGALCGVLLHAAISNLFRS